MSGMTIDTAMVLAAGFGTRMRPLTDTMPKPLIPLCGTPLIDWTMARLHAAGLTRFVVNSHYLADQIADHFSTARDVMISHEPDILETGGGVKKALPLLGKTPFCVVNTDTVWLDGPTPAATRMLRAFDVDQMDALLLLHPVSTAGGDYSGMGDYTLDPLGLAARRIEKAVAPYVFTGFSILSPDLFEDTPDGAFSLNRIFDRAEQAGRLHALVHDGEWYHVGTPDALTDTQQIIAQGHTAANTR